MCVNVCTHTSHSCRSHHSQLIRHTLNCRAAGNVCERAHAHIPLLPVPPRPAYTPYLENCRTAGNVCERAHAHIPLLPVPPPAAYTPYIPRTAEQLEMCVNVCTRTSHSAGPSLYAIYTSNCRAAGNVCERAHVHIQH